MWSGTCLAILSCRSARLSPASSSSLIASESMYAEAVCWLCYILRYYENTQPCAQVSVVVFAPYIGSASDVPSLLSVASGAEGSLGNIFNQPECEDAALTGGLIWC